MALIESEALILRSRARGEADKLLSVFTRACGRLRAVAPGGHRSRRRFGGALEPLSHIRLWFYDTPGRDVARLAQAELLESFWDLGGEYARTVAANHIAELCELLLPEREPSDRGFRLALAALGRLKQGGPVALPLTYFQLWSVRLAGWLPELERCGKCGKDLAGQGAYARAGALRCAGCRRAGMRALSREDMDTAREMLAKPLSRLSDEGWSERRAAALRAYLLDVIEEHAEKKLLTRELLGETKA